MAGPLGLLGNVEQWLVSHWYDWPSYLRAGVWAIAGAALGHWFL